MILVTGAYGFIGSVLTAKLNEAGYKNLWLADDFSVSGKSPNLSGKQYERKIEREVLFEVLEKESPVFDAVFHLGARTDTMEFDKNIFDKLNYQYSKNIWEYCTRRQIPLVYASSAATYGAGEWGFVDSHILPFKLKPLNPYGESKNNFDKWALRQKEQPPHWYGMKFFNVFGPNEYHKGKMASVVFHAFHQINNTGGMKLFRSHRKEFEDGKQLRDFIYVEDVVNVLLFMMEQKPASGLYNLGTGKARSFLSLAEAVFKALDKEVNISFIDMPVDIRDKYQYFTEAKMTKLLDAGYARSFYSLEEAVKEYVREYLSKGKYR